MTDPHDAETRRRDSSAEATSLRAQSAAQTQLRHTQEGAEQGTEQRTRGVSPAETTPPTFGEGYCLRGHYLIEGLIGQGAMGQVWRAKDLLAEEAKDRNPYVAVKVLNADLEGRPEFFIAMHREASRAQKLAHPNIVIVHVFDRDEISGRAFIVMELLEGRPLDRVIREDGPKGLPRKRALAIIRGMAEGLCYAHRKAFSERHIGVVHSDFKPANVFVTSDGTPKILDFGIARAVQVAAADAPESATHPEADADEAGIQGYTENYAAPETIAGGSPSRPAEDVFALGVVAYELFTGKHPFQGRSVLEARAKGIRVPPIRGVRRREAAVIESALAFDPGRRPADAGVFLKRLQGVPPAQKALLAAVGCLLVGSGGLWYRNYLESLPATPLSDLPPSVQREFHHKVDEGENSLAYLERTHDVTASADAAEYFGEAYQLHPKDPQAVRGLETAAGYAIAWYGKFPDHRQARRQLELFRAKSPFYVNYRPLERAIQEAGGE